MGKGKGRDATRKIGRRFMPDGRCGTGGIVKLRHRSVEFFEMA